jgi:hypothetical protein
MKKLTLLVLASILATVMTSCYKHTVCATYTKAVEKTAVEKNNDNL